MFLHVTLSSSGATSKCDHRDDDDDDNGCKWDRLYDDDDGIYPFSFLIVMIT